MASVKFCLLSQVTLVSRAAIPCQMHRGSDQGSVSIYADQKRDEFSNLGCVVRLAPRLCPWQPA